MLFFDTLLTVLHSSSPSVLQQLLSASPTFDLSSTQRADRGYLSCSPEGGVIGGAAVRWTLLLSLCTMMSLSSLSGAPGPRLLETRSSCLEALDGCSEHRPSPITQGWDCSGQEGVVAVRRLLFG